MYISDQHNEGSVKLSFWLCLGENVPKSGIKVLLKITVLKQASPFAHDTGLLTFSIKPPRNSPKRFHLSAPSK